MARIVVCLRQYRRVLSYAANCGFLSYEQRLILPSYCSLFIELKSYCLWRHLRGLLISSSSLECRPINKFKSLHARRNDDHFSGHCLLTGYHRPGSPETHEQMDESKNCKRLCFLHHPVSLVGKQL